MRWERHEVCDLWHQKNDSLSTLRSEPRELIVISCVRVPFREGSERTGRAQSTRKKCRAVMVGCSLLQGGSTPHLTRGLRAHLLVMNLLFANILDWGKKEHLDKAAKDFWTLKLLLILSIHVTCEGDLGRNWEGQQ